jgi:tetratricopeptide (TPR) repeat protein
MLKLSGLVVVLLVLLSGARAQGGGEVIAPITSALRAREFDRAIQLTRTALERSPRNPQIWTLQGIALSGAGDKKEALGAFQHALGLAPDYLPALEGAAQLEYEAGMDGASQLLQHILRLRPGDQTSYAMLAVLAYKHGDCKTAVHDFEQSGSLLDSQLAAVEQYGICLVRLNEVGQAVPVFQKALALQPDDGLVRYQLASVQLMAKHPQDTISTLTPQLRANTTDPKVLALAAAAYESQGDTPLAVQTLHRAIVANPRDIDLYVDFANICFTHKSFQVGIDMINAGLHLQPKAAPLYVARGVLYVQMAQYDKAEADFAEADQLDPGQAIGSAAEGLAAVQKNDLDQALATVQSKLAKRPNDPFLLYLQASVLTQKGPDPKSPEFQKALESAQKAVALQPNLAAARDVLGKLYLQAGDDQKAAEQSRAALAADPKDQTALYHLIQALRKTGDRAELADLLKQLAQLREAETKEERERGRYKLVEQGSEPGRSAQP